MIICVCKNISDSKIKELLESGLSMKKIKELTKVGTQCKICCKELKKIKKERTC